MNAGAVRGGDDVLRCGGAGGDDVYADFDFLAHQSGGIVHAGLTVDDELLRQQVQRFVVFGKRDGAGLLDCSTNVVAADFAGASAQRDAAVAVDAANVRSGDTDDGMLDGSLGDVFRLFDGLANRVNRLVEIGDYAFAHAARVGDSVATIAQSVLVDFGDDDAGLGASNVNDR